MKIMCKEIFKVTNWICVCIFTYTHISVCIYIYLTFIEFCGFNLDGDKENIRT